MFREDKMKAVKWRTLRVGGIGPAICLTRSAPIPFLIAMRARHSHCRRAGPAVAASHASRHQINGVCRYPFSNDFKGPSIPPSDRRKGEP
jgi:hypothetical protein